MPNPSKYDATFHTTADRHDDITETWIDSAKWMQEQDKWISIEEEPNPVEGYYWVVIEGQVQRATVNEKEFAEMVKQQGFWQYVDCQLDERVYPTHYMPFVLPSPPKTK